MSLRAAVLVSCCSLISAVGAQQGPPGPAPELKQLAALVGNWIGSGTAAFGPGAPPSKWQARGTYRWCLGNHFLQEDFEIDFEGRPTPLVFRAYLGWDQEGQRYVNALANSAGKVELHEMKVLPDGTMVLLMMQSQEGVPYAERSLLKIEGDKLVHSIDLLMHTGPSMTIVDGCFTRGEKSFDGAFDGPTFEGCKPSEPMQKLARSAGAYDVKGQVVMVPGQPAMKYTGVDIMRSWFGGTVMHAHTVGSAEGKGTPYEGELLWGYDEARRCIFGVYVDSMGGVRCMDAHFASDGKLVSTMATTMMGQPMVQRMVMEFDDKGFATRAVSHSIVGTAPPFESHQATYAKK